MTLSSRSSCISLLSSSRITRLLSHRIFYIPSTTSSCESLQRTLIYSVSILSSYPDCNAVTSANLVRCAVHALPTQSFQSGALATELQPSYNLRPLELPSDSAARAISVRKAEDTPVYAHNHRNRRNIDGGFEGTQNGLKPGGKVSGKFQVVQGEW